MIRPSALLAIVTTNSAYASLVMPTPFRVGLRAGLLLALWAVACENPLAPDACGPIPEVTVHVGETSHVVACFNDPNGDMLSYTVASSNPSVATASIAGTAITVSGVAPGSATVTLTASDPGGLQGQQSFAVTVPNRAPQPRGTPPDITVRVGETATVDAARYFADPDGEPLAYTAIASDGEVAGVNVAGSMVTVTAEAKGRATVTITARDPGGLSATQSFRFTVPNRPPVAVGALRPRTIEVGQTATLDVADSFSDPDGDALTYAARSSNGGVARVSVSGSTVTITAARPGTATITVTASDPDGLTATQQASVTVRQSNRAPQAAGSIPAQTLNSGGTATINASRYFTDPDGDALTYSARSSNGGVARVSVSGSTVTIRGVAAGSATITVTARDPGGLSATQTFTVIVGSAGAPDLEFTNVTPTSVTGSPGGSIEADFTIRNTGDAAAAATTIRLYQSSNSTISTNDSEISSNSFPSLAAGRSRTITGTVRLPSQASGTFYFGICIDAVAGESDTQNNCSRGVRVTVSGSGAPDLVVSLSKSSATVSPGGSFSYDRTVRNQGDAASAATLLRTFSSSNSTISTTDTQIGDADNVPSLQPSQQASGTARISVPASFPPGTFYLGECVDAVSGESDTDNNCSSAIRVTVQTGGGGSDTTYTTGQTIETLPTGFWVPNLLSGGSYQYSGGVVRVTLNGTGGYMVHNAIRYSCLTSGGCQIVNRRVTRGSIRASSQSSSSLIAEPRWDGLLQATGVEGMRIRSRPGETPSATGQAVEGTLRVKPGGEPAGASPRTRHGDQRAQRQSMAFGNGTAS